MKIELPFFRYQTRPIHRFGLALTLVALLIALLLPASLTVAEEAGETETPHPMAPFGRLVGGEWHGGPYYHVFEWGVGQKTLFGRTYSEETGELSSEARWFWHPGEQAIRGYAVDSTGAFFAEMTVRFEDETLINELTTIDAVGARTDFTGKWLFTDENTYDWSLWVPSEESLTRSMGVVFKRQQ